MENNKKELTLQDIAELIDQNKKALETKIDSSVEELARITNNNYLKLEADIKEVKSSVEDIKADLNKKVDKIDYNTLVYRVDKLEEKAGIAKSALA